MKMGVGSLSVFLGSFFHIFPGLNQGSPLEAQGDPGSVCPIRMTNGVSSLRRCLSEAGTGAQADSPGGGVSLGKAG